jgi:hypothetical protein
MRVGELWAHRSKAWPAPDTAVSPSDLMGGASLCSSHSVAACCPITVRRTCEMMACNSNPRRALLQSARRRQRGGSEPFPRLTVSDSTVAARLHCWVPLTTVTMQTRLHTAIPWLYAHQLPDRGLQGEAGDEDLHIFHRIGSCWPGPRAGAPLCVSTSLEI